MIRNRWVDACFVGLLIFIVYQASLVFWPFLQPIFWSGILAFACFPAYRWLHERWGWREPIAAFAVTLLLCVAVAPPAIAIGVRLSMQAAALYQESVAYVQDGRLSVFLESLRASSAALWLKESMPQWAASDERLSSWLLDALKALGGYLGRQAGTITKNLLVFAFHTVLTFVLVFVFLRRGERIIRFVYSVTPLKTTTKKAVFSQINETLSAVVRGQVLTSLAQGALAGLIFWFLGIPYPMVFGALTFLASLVPIAGSALVWVPLVAYLGLQQLYVRAALLFLLGAGGISLIDNILKPLLIGERTKLPYFLLFLGILGGIQVYGLIGVFLAPVVLSLFFALVTIYQKEYLSSPKDASLLS